MILYGGEIFDAREQDRLIAALDERICRTHSEKTLSPETVISAAEKLRADIKSGSPENVYIFYGEETYLRDRYLEELKAKIDAQ